MSIQSMCLGEHHHEQSTGVYDFKITVSIPPLEVF